LIGFGADASHAYERTHRSALVALARLTTHYLMSKPVAARDERKMASIDGFTEQLRPDEMAVPNTPLPVPHDFMEELLATPKKK
jgi:hypothetical protein